MSAELDTLLTLPEVTKATHLSRSAIYRRMNGGDFPRPLQLSTNVIRWKRAEIAEWLDSLPRAGCRDKG